MKITVYGYKESFLFTPSVKVYQDGRKLGEVSAKGALVLDNIAPGSVIKFKCGIRSTECVVSDPNIVLSFNRMTGCLEALATEHVDQVMIMQSAKDNNNVIMSVIIILVLLILLSFIVINSRCS